MSGVVQQAKDVVENSLVASLKAGAGTFVGTIIKGTLAGTALVAVVIGIVYALSDSWVRALVLALLVATAVGVASTYIGAMRAAGSAIVAANDEANLASHALTGVLALARSTDDHVVGGLGGKAASLAARKVAGAAATLGKEKSGVRGFVVGRAKHLLYSKVGAIAAVELDTNGVDWEATNANLENRIDGMVTAQVMGLLNRNALILAVPIVVGALILAVVVGLIPN